jgi:hypothetical protein
MTTKLHLVMREIREAMQTLQADALTSPRPYEEYIAMCGRHAGLHMALGIVEAAVHAPENDDFAFEDNEGESSGT